MTYPSKNPDARGPPSARNSRAARSLSAAIPRPLMGNLKGGKTRSHALLKKRLKLMILEKGTNPFRVVPLPLPLRGLHLTAPEIFTSDVLSERIRINRDWLAAQARTTRQIDAALFPQYEMAGMTRVEVFQQLNAALWEAGFRPDEAREDAIWSLPLEAQHPNDNLGDLWKGTSVADGRV